MAGDWIKMRTNLDTDPRVISLSESLSVPELHAIGMLWKVWAWADQHSIDGNAISVTDVTLDRFTSCTGFADALRKVGWLEGRDGALSFPRFAEHNGQTAKKRGKTAERVRKFRNAASVTDVTPEALPEKRREEKRRLKKGTIVPKEKTKFVKPTVQEVADYCRERKNGIDPEHFVAYYESKGWLVGKSPMKSWKDAMVTWERNEKKNAPASRVPTEEDLKNWDPVTGGLGK